LKKVTRDLRYEKYKDDPVKFGMEVLGDKYSNDIKDLMNSVRDNDVTIGRSSNNVGKTHCAARIAIWFFLCFDDAQVYTTAASPYSNLERILWGEINAITQKHPELFEGCKVQQMNIQKSPKSFITGVSIPTSGTSEQREARFSGKHNPNIMFILDEGDAIPDEVYKGIEASRTGGNCKVLILFNPRVQSGAVYRMERDGDGKVIEMSSFRHPNVRWGRNLMPGCVTRLKVVNKINEWTIHVQKDEKTDNSCFELPDFLVGQAGKKSNGDLYHPLPKGWRRVINPTFWYMFMGQYPPHGEKQLISQDWIYAARTRWDAWVAQYGMEPPKDIQPILGIDVAEFGNDSNVVVKRYGSWIAPFISWRGVDTLVTGDRCADIYLQCNALGAFVDATGIGTGVAPQMRRRGCRYAQPVKVAESPTEKSEMGSFGILRDQLWWGIREWLRTDAGAMLPPDEELLEELTVPTYDVRNGKVKVMSKDAMKEKLKRSPDRADALALSLMRTIKKAKVYL